MRVFLTGVSGGLGNVLAEQMAHLPETECITGIDVAEPKKSLPSKVRFVKMDIRSSDLAATMAGHDTVVHTAFLGLWQAKMPASVREDINVNGVRNVARAATINGVRRFVHTSSTAAYGGRLLVGKTNVTEDFPVGKGNSRFYYTNDKAAAERILVDILVASGTLLTVLRPCSFVGANSPQTLQILRNTAVKLPGHNPRGQVTHEDDVASAFLQAIRSDMPGAYNVVPDDFLREDDMWNIMRIKFVPTMPWPVAVAFMALRWRYFGSATHPLWLGARMADFTASNAKLKATGWRPHYGSADALRSVAGMTSL